MKFLRTPSADCPRLYIIYNTTQHYYNTIVNIIMLLFVRKINLEQEHKVKRENFDFRLFRKNTSDLNTGNIWFKKDKLKPLVASTCIVMHSSDNIRK
jgi:hypothetical protein